MSDYADPGDSARAFGRGADARIEGLPLSCNPYHSADTHLYKWWRQGWIYFHLHWGMDVPLHRRRPLPPVEEVA